MRRLACALSALVCALAAAPAPAAAAGPRLTEAQGRTFPERSWVLTLPERRDLAPADVELRENGRPVTGLSVVPGDEAGTRAFGVVLAIDASESMHSGAIEQAMAAAREFAARREPNQQLGLLLFSRDHRVALPMTTDQARIDAALAGVPPLTKGTRIFDAGAAAVDMLREAKVQAGSVVVMSDGADVGSVHSADALVRDARAARVRVFGVGLESPSFDPSALAAVAAGTGGAFSAAGSARQLTPIYASLGDQLAREYLVTYRSMAPLGARVDVQAGVAGVGTAAASYDVPALTAAPAPAPAATGGLTATTAGLALLFLLLVAVAVVAAVRRPKQTVSDRITAYVRPHRPSLLEQQAADAERPSAVHRTVERAFAQARWWPRFREDVQLAGVGMSAAQLVALTAGATLTMVWLMVALDRPVAAVLLALTPLAARILVRVRTNRVRRAFADQLPDNLQVVASAMRAGHSFEGGLAVAAEDAAEPMRSELRRVVADERLGVPLEEAMATVARRMQSPEFEQVGMILSAQRQTGGNVAELLDHTVTSLRHRADLRRLVSSLTSQGRFSGGIVTALPFGAALFLSTVQPGYFDPMLESSVGRLLIVLSLLMMLTAWAVIRRVIDIKV